VTGYAFAERDVAGLTERLLALLTDDALAARFSAAGPPFVAANHDLHKQTAQLEALYDRVAGVKP
jgi:glycosyltransferase involved in cell wall biosynthesis